MAKSKTPDKPGDPIKDISQAQPAPSQAPEASAPDAAAPVTPAASGGPVVPANGLPGRFSATVIYIGPPLPGIGLPTGSTFRGGLVANISAAVRNDPDLAELFVTLEDVARAKHDLKRPGSRLNKIAGRVAAKHHKEG